LISLDETPYYHLTSRCVRRAFLCGVDHYSGRNYEHRRQWIVDRIRLLSSLFAIDICAYAVMSNHYHLVVKACPDQLDELADDEIIDRWCALFKGPLLIQRYLGGELLSKAELLTVAEIVQVWRKKLSSISWFMRCLNQPIARQANREDGCTGKFWECRFTSQALKTEEALLSCMAYVDLNPVRAGMAETPETSDYTSIRERIHPSFDLEQAKADQFKKGGLLSFNVKPKPLLSFSEGIVDGPDIALPYVFREYLDLVEWTGRVIRDDKRGFIAPTLPSMLAKLELSIDRWVTNTTRFEAIHASRFNRAPPSLNAA